MQGLGADFKSSMGDKARDHVAWAEAVRALQENIDEGHVCHCKFMSAVWGVRLHFLVGCFVGLCFVGL